jgi:hypothetical protein
VAYLNILSCVRGPVTNNNGFWIGFIDSSFVSPCSPFNADQSGRAVEGMKCLRPLEHWDRGFESHSRHECLCTFILCVGSSLETG